MRLTIGLIVFLQATFLAAADIVANKPLGLQHGFTQTTELTREDQQELNLHLGLLDDVTVFPDRTAPIGNTHYLSLAYEYGLFDDINLGAQLHLAEESVLNGDGFFNEDSPFNLALTLFSRYRLLKTDRFAFTMTPFIELGQADRNHFSYGSKSKIALLTSASYSFQPVVVTANLQYRYRPSEIHDFYRIASDWSTAVQVKSNLDGNLQFWLESATQFGKVLNVNKAADRYQNIVSGQIGLGSKYQTDLLGYGLSYRAPIGVRELGVAQHQFLLSVDWQIRADDEASNLEEKRERLRRLDEIREDLKNHSLESPAMIAEEQKKSKAAPEAKETRDKSESAADEEIKQISEQKKKISAEAKANVFDRTISLEPNDKMLPLPEPSSQPSH